MAHSRDPWILFTTLTALSTKTTTGMTMCPLLAQSLTVATSEEAKDLATVLNCSGGGVFDVTWEGTVLVEETITVMEGSVLTINGLGSDAIADGSGATQLFKVNKATLQVTDLGLMNGIGDYGGALYIANASVTLRGHTQLRDNVGQQNGGALWIGGENSVVFWDGTTTFTKNSASSGGAVAVEERATVEWSGDTSFDRNIADSVYGGAVFVSTAKVSWTGTTNFTENYAGVGAGALYSEKNSVVMWSGQTLFSNNSARYYGGATLARLSFVSWEGGTTFRRNHLVAALEDGGAFQAENSTVKWQGNAWFIENRGSRGGALHLDDGANVSWKGETIFRGNGVDLAGGALYLSGASTVSWERAVTTFQNNSALGNFYAEGGAISVNGDSGIHFGGLTYIRNNTAEASGGALVAGAGSRINFIADSHTVFEDNKSGTTGGAVALSNVMSLDLQANAINLSFIGNVAGIAGGAVYQTGITSGLSFLGVTFTSNSAPIGGAVYSLASGTDELSFTDFVDCYFHGNTATTSGGAIESAAGKDSFLNTTFESNTAEGVGGALRLAGTSIISNCKFDGNGAHEAGPAVTNEGRTTVEKTSFTMNMLMCSPGTFLNYSTKDSAGAEDVEEGLYYESICDGCEPCADCIVDGQGMQECILTLEHTESAGVVAGVSITLETLDIKEGYWRAVANSTRILPCWNSEACLGGITFETGYCKEGYSGAYCAVCEDGYAAALSYTCSKCSGADGLVVVILALAVAPVVLAGVIVHLLSAYENSAIIGARRTMITTPFWELVQAIPSQALKTIVVSWQILTQLDSVADVTYPGTYGRFLDGLGSIINLDLGLMLSAGCAVKTDFHDRLLISTLGPFAALGALAVCFRVAARRYRGAPEALEGIRRKHFSLALLVTFLVYSSVSSTIFRMFACEELDDGEDYLRADYSILCTSSKHRALQGYAVFMIFVYPVGIPLFYGILLFGNREVLQENRRRSDLSSDLELIADLWKPYKPERYYYEIVECKRRVALTGVVVFIYPNTAGQVAITLLLSFAFLVLSDFLDPYASSRDTWISRVGHMVVFLSMFQALLIKVDVSDERSESQRIFGEVLLTVHVGMVLAVIAETAMSMRSFCWRASPEDTAEPRFRSNDNPTRVMESFDTTEREEPSLLQ